jgi:acetyl-CoA carboxylase carboxyltransferase component
VVHLSDTQRVRRRRRGQPALRPLFDPLRLAVGALGSLPLEGGIEAAYRAEIDAAVDPEAKRAEIEARLEKLRSPFRTAEAFWIEEMIDPRDTRKLLVEFAGLAEKLRHPGESKFYMRP